MCRYSRVQTLKLLYPKRFGKRYVAYSGVHSEAWLLSAFQTKEQAHAWVMNDSGSIHTASLVPYACGPHLREGRYQGPQFRVTGILTAVAACVSMGKVPRSPLKDTGGSPVLPGIFSNPHRGRCSLISRWPSSSAACATGWWRRHTGDCLVGCYWGRWPSPHWKPSRPRVEGALTLLLPTGSDRGKPVFRLKKEREAASCFQPIQLRCRQLPCGR